MSPAGLTKDRLLALYRNMLVVRLCEQQFVKAHQMGLIPGPCHTYVGEEAIATGVCAHLNHDDVVFSTHRGHGHALSKGVPPKEVMAELFGREGGCSRGRGGSMHLFSPEVGMMGTSGIVGPCILQAAGGGYSFKILNVDRVSVAFFGDGAVNNGAFHEGLNLAEIYKLPVLFVCENNQFATEVAFEYATRNTDVASRGAAYDIPAEGVDGNDVEAVYAAAERAVERARSGHGPTLIEGRTYRTRPHAEGMGDGGYRSADDIESWKQRDPISVFRARIVNRGDAKESEVDAIDAEVEELIAEAFEYARESAFPDPASATDTVYSSD